MSAFRYFAVKKFLPRLQTRFPLKEAGFISSIHHKTLSTEVPHFSKWRSVSIVSTGDAAQLVRQLRPLSMNSILYSDIKTVVAPAFAESVTEGDINWEKAVGDSVTEDEVIAEIETDKTAIPVPAPVSGIIEELLLEDGGRVLAGDELCRIRMTDASTTTTPTKEDTPTALPPSINEAPPTPTPSVSGPIPTTPPPVPSTPTKPIGIEPTPPPPLTNVRPVSSDQPVPGTRNENRVKMTRMRQRIAQRLKEAQNVNAMLTTFNEVDMTSLIEMRKKYQDSFVKRHGLKLGFVSPFVKAACFALQDQPVVNAVIDGNEIVYRDYVDISIAVATPKGLVVPVVRNVETMNFPTIEKSIYALGEKARNGNLAIEDMDGGTFTVSNGGVFGSMFGTPIINPPQSAILGMHAVFDRPVAINGKIEIRPMMYIALTYDHRLIDGREAVLFLKKIKSAVEDPRVLLLDV